MEAATAPGASAVFGCFAPDGPQHCSGLPVARYSPSQLARQLGTRWLLISQEPEEHTTPAGTIQPFTWIAVRKRILSPGSRPRLQSGFSAISQNPSAGSTCASINVCSAAFQIRLSMAGRPTGVA